MGNQGDEGQKDEPVAGRADRREDKQLSSGVQSRVCGNTKVAGPCKGKDPASRSSRSMAVEGREAGNSKAARNSCYWKQLGNTFKINQRKQPDYYQFS